MQDFKDLIKKLSWILSNAKNVLPFLVLLTIINSLLSLVGVYNALLSKSLIDAAISGDTNLVIKWLIVMTSIILAKIFIKPITSLLTTYSSIKLKQNMQKKVYNHIARSEWMDVSKHHSISLLTRLTSDTATITSTLVGTIPGMISLAVTLIASFATLLSLSPYIAVAAIILGPFLFLINRLFSKKLKDVYKEIQEEDVKYKSFVQESINNLLIVKTFCLEDDNLETIESIQKNRMRLALKKTKLRVTSRILMKLSSSAAYITIFSWGAINISKGLSSYGSLTAMLQLYNNVKTPIGGLAGTVPEFISSIAAAERLMELEEMSLESSNKAISYSESAPIINFKNVSFGYKKSSTVINNINFSINPGETIALIGPSGEGKTTLIRLLLSLIHSDNGNITLKYQDEYLENINKYHRELISYVPQGNTLFSGTIKDNLKLGNKNATDSDIEEATRLACAYDFITDLDDGFDTLIGEKDSGISGGQAQRLSIARAFLRKRPILILDEATSSLDTDTEFKVIQSIKNLKHKPTCIIITHRPSALAICDRVYKLEGGYINEIENLEVKETAFDIL